VITESQICREFHRLLLNQTAVGGNVYIWRTTPNADDTYINIVPGERTPELDDSRGAYKTGYGIAIVLRTTGANDHEADTTDMGALDALDALEIEVHNIIDKTDQTLGISGVMGTRLTRTFNRTEDRDPQGKYRYLIYTVTARVRKID
jgi:hypothetical protein